MAECPSEVGKLERVRLGHALVRCGRKALHHAKPDRVGGLGLALSLRASQGGCGCKHQQGSDRRAATHHDGAVLVSRLHDVSLYVVLRVVFAKRGNVIVACGQAKGELDRKAQRDGVLRGHLTHHVPRLDVRVRE